MIYILAGVCTYLPPVSVAVRGSEDGFALVDLEFRFIPDAYALRQNYPNPFNPVTTITYDLADAGFVSLKVYNMLGQEVINLVSADRKAGVYTVQWNGTGHTGHPVSSGVYFYVLNADQFTSVKKMVFMK